MLWETDGSESPKEEKAREKVKENEKDAKVGGQTEKIHGEIKPRTITEEIKTRRLVAVLVPNCQYQPLLV